MIQGRPTLLPIDPSTVPDVGFSRMRVTSPYADRDDPLRPGSRVFHGGIDIGNARVGDVLTSVAYGLVEAVGYLSYPWSQPKPTDAQWSAWGYLMSKRPSLWQGPTFGGQMIVIRGGGEYYLYAHCGSISVQVGQVVQAGSTRIGTIGESGAAYGAGHVHFGAVRATPSQLDALRVGRGVIGRSMTYDPWPRIALFAGGASLPDTSVPSEVEMDFGNALHQIPKIVRIKGGSILYENSTGSKRHWVVPDDQGFDADLLLSLDGRFLCRRLGEGPAFFVGSASIDNTYPRRLYTLERPAPVVQGLTEAQAQARVDSAIAALNARIDAAQRGS